MGDVYRNLSGIYILIHKNIRCLRGCKWSLSRVSLTVDRILMTFHPLQPYLHLAVVERLVSSSNPETKLTVASLPRGSPTPDQTNTGRKSDADFSEAGSSGIRCGLSTEQMML